MERTDYKPEPHRVLRKKGSMITAKSDNSESLTTRNSSYFKKVPKDSLNEPGTDNDPDGAQNITRHYPTRNRRPTQHLKDYVKS